MNKSKTNQSKTMSGSSEQERTWTEYDQSTKDSEERSEDNESIAERNAEMTAEINEQRLHAAAIETQKTILVNDSLQRLITENECKSEEKIKQMKDLIEKMNEALQKQPNVNRTIKEGLPQLEEILEQIEEVQRATLRARQQLQRGIANFPQCNTKDLKKRSATRPSLDTPVEFQIKKKQMDLPEPKNIGMMEHHTTPVQKQDNWKDVTTKSARRKKIAEEKRNKEPPNATMAVGAKKQKKNERIKKKPDAILIRPAKGRTYAEVISDIRNVVKPEDSEVEVRAVRKTRAGDVLLELKKTTADARCNFANAIQQAAGGEGNVKQLVARETVEIRDVDSCTTKEEIEDALHRELGQYKGTLMVYLTRPNNREQRLAIVTLETEASSKLVKLGRMRIGFIYSRVRIRPKRAKETERCFKCLGLGHNKYECRGPDRSNQCLRCSQEGHYIANCPEQKPWCFLCKEAQVETDKLYHQAGSRICGMNKVAQAKINSRNGDRASR